MTTHVYTGGTFDCLHAGHMNFFRQIQSLFDGCELFVGLNTDDFVTEYKGKPPIFSYQERERHLELCGLVDHVIMNRSGEDSKPTIISAFGITEYCHGFADNLVIAIGQDWLARDYCKQMQFDHQWLTDHNISLVYVPHTDGVSTTEIRARLSHEY